MVRPDQAHRGSKLNGVPKQPRSESLVGGSVRGGLTEDAQFLPRIAPPSRWYQPLKRCVDLAFVALLALPVVVVVAVAGLLVKVTSVGPMLYSQIRVGRGGERFRIWKLRTMVHNCERESGPRWATALDARITPLGRVLRKFHVDELPQLWNVLTGDMSVVGPRPERPEFVPLLAEAMPDYPDRLAVQPGMTGLAQVQLPPDSTLDSVRRKLKYDRHYVLHLTPWLDFKILATTAYYLLQVPYDHLPAWLQVPSGAAVELVEEEPPARFPPRLQSQDTKIMPETRVVSNGRA